MNKKNSKKAVQPSVPAVRTSVLDQTHNNTMRKATQFTKKMYYSLCYHNGIEYNKYTYQRVCNDWYNKYGQEKTAEAVSGWIGAGKMPERAKAELTPTADDEAKKADFGQAIKSAKSVGRELVFNNLDDINNLIASEIDNGTDERLILEIVSSHFRRVIKAYSNRKNMRMDASAKAKTEPPMLADDDTDEMPTLAPTAKAVKKAEVLKLIAQLL